MSKPDTPCLPGCREVKSLMTRTVVHAIGCVNWGDLVAPKAEAPQCRCGVEIGHVCHSSVCVPVCDYHEFDCPERDKAEAPPATPKDVVRTPGCSVLSEVGQWGCSYHQAGDHCAGDNGTDSTETFFRWPIQKPAPPAPVSEPPIDPLQTLDAQLWAKEFMRIWSGRWAEVDEGLMIAWFANAIMRGFDEASNRTRAAAERDALKAQNADLEADYQRIIREIIPHAKPASGREDDQLEPPWEVVSRLAAELERLRDLISALSETVDGEKPTGKAIEALEMGRAIRAAREAGK